MKELDLEMQDRPDRSQKKCIKQSKINVAAARRWIGQRTSFLEFRSLFQIRYESTCIAAITQATCGSHRVYNDKAQLDDGIAV